MRDHYEVLGISIECSEEDIKTAYRKKALQWHPDRNFGNVEEATKQFADAQIAYETLSEPNDRAWYDRHRESILRGEQEASNEEATDGGLSAMQLTRLFSKVEDAKLDDTPTGFFAEMGRLFEAIVQEEELACSQLSVDVPNYPAFGGSRADEHHVKGFYSAWTSFRTHRTFAWADRYSHQHAPDRRVRRAMDKENAKARAAEKQDFVETVQRLVSLAKKRDFRYIVKPTSERQRLRDLKESRKSQAANARAAHQASLGEYEEQAWQKVGSHQKAEEEMHSYDWVETQIECVACNKTFKNERTFQAHENSRKHIQTVKRLKWELKKEAISLGLEIESSSDLEDATDEEKAPSDVPTTAASAHTREPAEVSEDRPEAATVSSTAAAAGESEEEDGNTGDDSEDELHRTLSDLDLEKDSTTRTKSTARSRAAQAKAQLKSKRKERKKRK